MRISLNPMKFLIEEKAFKKTVVIMKSVQVALSKPRSFKKSSQKLQACTYCRRDHRDEPCMRQIGACLRCGEMHHFICDYPHIRRRPVCSIGSTVTPKFQPKMSISPQRQRSVSAPPVTTQGPQPPTP